MKTIHIVGNGPGKKYFSNPSGDFVFGCNYGEPSIKEMEWVFIHDARVFRNMERLKKRFPYSIMTKACFRSGIDTLHRRKIINKRVIFLPEAVVEKSAGHDAIHYSIINPEIQVVHLWGFDSILDDDMSSDSKGKIKGSDQIEKLLPFWKKRFFDLFQSAKTMNTSFLIHRNTEDIVKVS